MDEKIAEDQVGKIKCYMPLKGFGFISRPKGKDVFFLRTDASNEAELADGATVSFQVRMEKKGPRAFQIKRLG